MAHDVKTDETKQREPTDEVRLWKKRRGAAKDVYDDWTKECRVLEGYNYWRGNQLEQVKDRFGNRRAMVNKIHADVSKQLPSLYFYRPYARITPQPELADTPGSEIDADSQLMQDTVNHLIRVPGTRFDPSTRMATKESQWAMGIVEVGYEIDFMDSPDQDHPALKEEEDTKAATSVEIRPEDQTEQVEGGSMDKDERHEETELETELQDLKQSIRGERFFVKHIPAKQFMISQSDKPILEDNDWVGYWEDVPVEDVKRSPAYSKNAKFLEAVPPGDDETERKRINTEDDEAGNPKRVRIYKIWDLRNKEKLVMAEGHGVVLFRKKFKRLGLLDLRFDIDPYHWECVPTVA